MIQNNMREANALKRGKWTLISVGKNRLFLYKNVIDFQYMALKKSLQWWHTLDIYKKLTILVGFPLFWMNTAIIFSF